MSSLFDKRINQTFQGVIHSGGAELPESGQKPLYDGLGNKTAISVGRDGQGVTFTAPVKAGTLEYPTNNGGTGVGAVMTQLSGNKLGLRDVSDLFIEFVNILHPVNSILITIDNVNPGSRITGTTWEQVSKGKVIGGVGGNGFQAEDNDSTWTRSVTVPEHYHGVGQYSAESNNDIWLITAREDARLPSTGWSDPDQVYWSRKIPGDGGLRGTDKQFSDGASKTRAAITSRPFSYEGGNITPTVSIDITPPTYGVYVWKRTA